MGLMSWQHKKGYSLSFFDLEVHNTKNQGVKTPTSQIYILVP